MGTVKTLLDAFGYELKDATYQDALLAGIMLEATPAMCWATARSAMRTWA